MLPQPPTHYGRKKSHVHALRGRVGLVLVACLSMLAGMTDAIGLLATGDFVSFMSGNTTRLAIAAGEADFPTAARLALAVLCFVAGNALGVILTRWFHQRASYLLLVTAALLASAAISAPHAPLPGFCSAIVAMGLLNAVVEHVNGLPLGLTYVTGALSRFGRGLGRWLLGERAVGWRVQLVPWGGMLVGAAAGGVLEHRLGYWAFAASAALALLLVAAMAWVPHRWQAGFMAR